MAEGWTNVCCNPFSKPAHYVGNQKQLRPVTDRMLAKAPIISRGQKICTSCRIELSKTKEIIDEAVDVADIALDKDSSSDTESSDTSESETIDTNESESMEPVSLVNCVFRNPRRNTYNTT